LRALADVIEGRWMLVRKAERIPVECVVRGYLAGSGLQEYRERGSINGIALPPGIPPYGRIAEPIFTPTTKEDVGHDRPITQEDLASIVGVELARDLRNASLRIFDLASRYALSRGLVLVDTKFEFGWIDGRLALIDEALTPDSSRWWDVSSLDADTPESLDKEYVRAYLKTLKWDRNPPAPSLPEPIIAETLRRYRLVHDRLGADGPLPNLFA
jgi:phosphoribosylaminoimidazole-succinocarboxamide synthase